MDTQNRGIELALFLTLPATAAFIFAAEPIIRGLFQHGAFHAADTVRCGWALSAFSIGLPSYVLVKVLTPGFYARADTATPVRLAIYSVAVNLVGNLILIPTLGPLRARPCRPAAGDRARVDPQRLHALPDAPPARPFRGRRPIEAPRPPARARRRDHGRRHLLPRALMPIPISPVRS